MDVRTSTWQLTATQMLDGFRRGELSPVEATEATLTRIEEVDPAVNAFCLVDRDAALEQARASERRWSRGEPLGAVDGVPTSIKDMFLTRGWPTLRGSQLVDPEQEWDEDAPNVARLREHGAVLVGKTTTPEFGWKGVTDSPLRGVTRNPWDPSRTAGGSSGGAAAAAALGMSPLAIGTDAGGSVRIPASFCGVFALKPTYGRIPLYPASPFGTLAHAGPMTWSVEDAALMLDVVSRPDSRDWSQLAPSAPTLPELDRGVDGLRVAYSPTLGYVDVDPEVAGLVRDAVKVFEERGAHVEEVDPGFGDPIEAFNVLWYSGAAKVLSAYPAERRAEADPALVEIVQEGERYSALDYLEATARRMALGVHMGRFHDTYDLLLTPTMPLVAFEAGQEVPTGWSSGNRWTSWTQFTYPFNLTQQPAASVPCGFTAAGLPVGLQLVAARHADALVMAASKAFQDDRPWLDRRPQL